MAQKKRNKVKEKQPSESTPSAWKPRIFSGLTLVLKLTILILASAAFVYPFRFAFTGFKFSYGPIDAFWASVLCIILLLGFVVRREIKEGSIRAEAPCRGEGYRQLLHRTIQSSQGQLPCLQGRRRSPNRPGSADIAASPGWHQLRITMIGDRMLCRYDLAA